MIWPNGTNLFACPVRMTAGMQGTFSVPAANPMAGNRFASTDNPIALKTASTPEGYGPSAHTPPKKAGGIAAGGQNSITSAHSVSASLWSTKQLSSNLSSGNTISGNAALIVSFYANVLSENTASADIKMTLQIAANLASQGQISAALGAVAYCVSTMIENETLDDSNLRGSARMEAALSTEGTATTARACAEAVWKAVAASFNDPGSMGEKLNDAGGGSSPETIADAVWAKVLP